MTIREALKIGQMKLQDMGILTASLDCEILLASSLNISRTSLFIDFDEEIDPDIYLSYLERRSQFEPVAYITNSKEFYGRDFYVNNQVLIPRPDSEVLIDEVKNQASKIKENTIYIVDLGTGSGVLGITLALELKNSEILGIDVSDKALEVAKLNASSLSASNISFVKSDLFKDVSFYNLDILVANLPYVPTTESKNMEADVLNFEPHQAIFSGNDGLAHYRRMFQEIYDRKIKINCIIIEIFYNQKDSLFKLIRELFGKQVKVNVFSDLEGRDRVLKIEF